MPWAIIRTIIVFFAAVFFFLIEIYFSLTYQYLAGLAFFIWTIFAFVVIWIFSILDAISFWATTSYILCQEGLEIRGGTFSSYSLMITPADFIDLCVNQSLGGRIFGYGEITVNSRDECKTRLGLVRSPYIVADKIKEVLNKSVSVKNKV